ncbi:ABC transporter ATP-binding protein [uncultured Desulfosarcina sp.]|uniref:ABC transporter ATP-binding protein n=1 Tax=uncultured Desulfosarcina sp. TaxID=218289 RepID=UPI0029C931A2|nr:ABC transporter ATP-binding protein [uncultured Desulfosarcina sp.]
MIFSVNKIRFSYNSHPVLDNVSFDLKEGSVLAVLGVNGAGKSTLLKCLNRILTPQSGSVFLGKEDLHRLPQNTIARKMGYVPQRHNPSQLTVYESILMGRRPHMGWTVSKADYAVVEQTLQRMGLSELALRPVSDLSGGEAQKVMIARALAQEPRILLLDEPTSNLDLKNQIEVMGLIRSVIESQGIIVIVAIHDLNLALRFADRFLFIRDHRVHGIADHDTLDTAMIEQVYGLRVSMQEVSGHRVVVPV